MIDTNADPTQVDYPIPSNDDASSAIELIMKAVGSAIEEGLAIRKSNLEAETTGSAEQVTMPSRSSRERNVEKIMSSRDVVAPKPRKTTVAGTKHIEKAPKQSLTETSAPTKQQAEAKASTTAENEMNTAAPKGKVTKKSTATSKAAESVSSSQEKSA